MAYGIEVFEAPPKYENKHTLGAERFQSLAQVQAAVRRMEAKGATARHVKLPCECVRCYLNRCAEALAKTR